MLSIIVLQYQSIKSYSDRGNSQLPATLINREVQSGISQVTASALNFPFIHTSRILANPLLETNNFKKLLINPGPYFRQSLKANMFENVTNRSTKMMAQTLLETCHFSQKESSDYARRFAVLVSSITAGLFDLGSIPMPNKTPSESVQYLKSLPYSIKLILLSLVTQRNAFQMHASNPTTEKSNTEKFFSIGGSICFHILAIISSSAVTQLKQLTAGHFIELALNQIKTANLSRLLASATCRFTYTSMVSITAEMIFNQLSSYSNS